jgi:hypothetical protein
VNATFQFKDQLQAGWDNAKQYLSQGLDLLGASIAAGFYKEHNADDTHSTINATGKIYERGRTLAIGEWKTVPYNALQLFTADGDSTVTINPPTVYSDTPFAYCIVGNTCFVDIRLNVSITRNVDPSLGIKVRNFIPGIVPDVGTTTDHAGFVAICYTNNVSPFTCLCFVDTFDCAITFELLTGDWATSANTVINGQFCFRIK